VRSLTGFLVNKIEIVNPRQPPLGLVDYCARNWSTTVRCMEVGLPSSSAG
jgi:hypothetical protein